MRLAVPLLAIALIGNSSESRRVEIATKFVRLIKSKNYAAAKRMLASDAKISTWNDEITTFDQFARFISNCRVTDVKVRASNIMINSDCPNDGGTSLMFSGHYINEIDWGPAPVIQTVVAPSTGAH
jgi:hypothetical protein